MDSSQLAWIAIAVMIVYGIGRFIFALFMYRRIRAGNTAEARRLYQSAGDLRETARAIKEKQASQRTFDEERILWNLDDLVYRAEELETKAEFIAYEFIWYCRRLVDAAIEFAMLVVLMRLAIGLPWPSTLAISAIIVVLFQKISWISAECGRLVTFELSDKARRRSKAEGMSYQQAFKEMALDRFRS